MANSALLDDLEKQFADNPRRVFARLANEYRKSGDFERAVEICRAHIPQQPGYISGYIVLGQALCESGQLEDARQTLETALGLDPENLIALGYLGDIARESGDLDSARAWYSRLLEVDPQNDEAAGHLAAIGALVEETVRTDSSDEMSWSDIHPDNQVSPETATADTMSSAGAPATGEPASPDEDPTEDAVPVASLAPDEGEAWKEGETAAAATVSEASESAPDDFLEGRMIEIDESDEAYSSGFVTETMADLYLSQGFKEQALHIFRQLAREGNGTDSMRERAEEIERQINAESSGRNAGPVEPADAPEVAGAESDTPDSDRSKPRSPVTIREVFAVIAQRRPPTSSSAYTVVQSDDEATAPVVESTTEEEPAPDAPMAELFAEAPSESDEAAAAMLAEAFPAEASNVTAIHSADAVTGQPSRAASDELSLDAVFGFGRRGPEGTRGGVGGGPSAVSFDEFFSTEENRGPSGAADSGDAEKNSNGSSQRSDVEMFHTWLEGLKK